MGKETILITGGSGFLGTNIAIEATEQGHKVIVMDNFVRRGSSKNADILEKKYGVEVLHGETRIEQDWNQLPKVDAVIHLAGQPGIPASLANPKLDFQVNAVGTLNGLEFARARGDIPFLYASTNKIYSDAINQIPLIEKDTRYIIEPNKVGLGFGAIKGINETFPMDSAGEHPHSPYGVSKASGDLLCQEWYHAFGVPTVVMRMSCIYGLYQHGVSEQGWTDFFVRQRVLGDNKLTFYGDGKQVRDCLFGTDAAQAYLLALKNIDKSAGKVFNLGGGEFNSSLIEWVDILNTYPNKEGKLDPMEISYSDFRLADHRIYISDTTKIQETLGWQPKVDIKTGIATMVEAYQGDFYK